MPPSIDSTLAETRSFAVSADFARQANMNAETFARLNRQATEDPHRFWGDLAREYLDWDLPFQQVLEADHAPFYRWFSDGQLNVAHNCVDRHLQGATRHKAALIWEGEHGDDRLWHHGHVDRDPIPLLYPLMFEGIGKKAHFAV